MPHPPERVLQPGREQLVEVELGDELVRAQSPALLDRSQETMGVAEAGRGNGAHPETLLERLTARATRRARRTPAHLPSPPRHRARRGLGRARRWRCGGSLTAGFGVGSRGRLRAAAGFFGLELRGGSVGRRRLRGAGFGAGRAGLRRRRLLGPGFAAPASTAAGFGRRGRRGLRRRRLRLRRPASSPSRAGAGFAAAGFGRRRLLRRRRGLGRCSRAGFDHRLGRGGLGLRARLAFALRRWAPRPRWPSRRRRWRCRAARRSGRPSRPPRGRTACGFALAFGFGVRAVADLGAAGAPGLGAPTASGAGEVSGFGAGGTVVSSSSRKTRPARSAAALRPRPAAVSISFFGSDGIRASSCPPPRAPMRRPRRHYRVTAGDRQRLGGGQARDDLAARRLAARRARRR